MRLEMVYGILIGAALLLGIYLGYIAGRNEVKRMNLTRDKLMRYNRR